MGVYFSNFVDINPRVNLEKGKEYPFVEMSEVDPVRRYVNGLQKRLFQGGGTRFRAGDTLFARITPCLENGKIAQFISSEQIGFGSTEFFVFRAVPNISDPGFVYYLSKSDLIRQPAEKSMTGASGRQRADLNSIVNVEAPVVSLAAQRKIAAILSAYDDLIENNLRRIKILEEMAQNLYREWFVNFRFPGHENTRFVDSPLGKIPVGWEVKCLKDLLIFKNKGTKAGEHLANLAYLPIDLLPRKSLAISEVKPWEEAKSSLHLFEEGDFLFGAMRPYFHKVVIAPFNGVTRKTCFVFASKKPQYRAFALLTLFQESTVAYANAHSKGATIPYAVWPNSMENMQFAMPPESYAVMFENSVGPIIERIKMTYHNNKNLRQTRDLLLPKLISGEVDVSELDIKVPEEVAI